MTTSEQKTVNELLSALSAMRKENADFKETVTKMVSSMNEKVEQKHIPISLESNILSKVQSAIDVSISETLKGYNSPLLVLIRQVVESRSGVLRDIITSSFDEVIALPDFKKSIVAAFSHKVAKSIISNNDGLFDKVSNELKQDAIFKSKMQIAVSNVVLECIANSNLK